MLTRRLAIASALAVAATSALAQSGQMGGKDSGNRPAQAMDISGNYTAEGRNPDGSAYSGQVRITQQGTRIAFAWQVGNDSYSGEGLIDGRVVAVDWGATTPVVYVVMPDGELHGTWDDGKALERLLPR